MKKYFVFSAIVVALVFLCQACPGPSQYPQYTIRLRVMNGTTHKILAKQEVMVYFFRPNLRPSLGHVGGGTTDSTGLVTIKYSGFTDDTTKFYIIGRWGYKYIATSNKNINDTLYFSDSARLKIYLKTNNPLETNHDTLFLGTNIFDPSILKIDSTTKTINGYYKTVRTTNRPIYDVMWGRGWFDFHYNQLYTRFQGDFHYSRATIKGDPYIDSVTVNY